MRFRDRGDAGRALAEALRAYARRPDVLVLALPRGGVVVGFELARELGVALDVYLVRKLGAPGREELAMGAIASDGTRVMNDDVVAALGITRDEIARIALREGRELERRERTYRGGRAAIDVRGRTVILVDDGLATGASMRVAALAVRAHEPERLVIAVPVAPRRCATELRAFADEVVCLDTSMFRSVGSAYEDFSQTQDEEVCDLLARARASAAVSEVVGHDLVDPAGLADLAARTELPHVGLDVEHRRAVDRIEPLHAHARARHREQPAGRGADAVRATLATLGENADLGPGRVVARPAGVGRDRGEVDEVEEVDDLDVAELGEAAQRRGLERGVQLDRGLDRSPVVVDRLTA